MATTHPRVQVTVDPELSAALEAVDAHPQTRSGLIRDMALRGARAAAEEQRWAHEYLARFARGEIDYDFDALREMLEAREAPFR